MRKLMVNLHMHTRDLILRRLAQTKHDHGASILEYAAVIVLVAGVAIALLQLQVFDNLVNRIQVRVNEVLTAME
ncbi:hypothetical protein [Streptomonospora salina]|uniref:Flp pilus assembly pilin Flp n=1 Tax=Streptomonospora salina TaxID=104205 RepID=A0A841E2P9_9ACTN|nr:hypothetical protein [Streptomonospora salina]MBB5997306.1 Flp pilus assembly pilin Flp [Streptomonospora salina]